VKVTASSDSAVGASRAANAPCAARAASSTAKLPADPPSADASAKPVSPIKKVRFRPMASATRPPTSSSPPKARVYAVMTHWRSASEALSARCAQGSAMLTMVASSAAIS
jgi:hypothetical protein